MGFPPGPPCPCCAGDGVSSRCLPSEKGRCMTTLGTARGLTPSAGDAEPFLSPSLAITPEPFSPPLGARYTSGLGVGRASFLRSQRSASVPLACAGLLAADPLPWPLPSTESRRVTVVSLSPLPPPGARPASFAATCSRTMTIPFADSTAFLVASPLDRMSSDAARSLTAAVCICSAIVSATEDGGPPPSAPGALTP